MKRMEKENVMALLAEYAEKHPLAAECGSEYIINGWISIDERLPDTDDFILLSFSNFTNPLVGRYETDEDGSRAFYIGDELETCLSQNIFVNAWQPLPEPLKED